MDFNPLALLAVLAFSASAWPGNASEGRRVCVKNAAGDGRRLDTEAIQKSIDTLATEGGGTLVIPKGTFLTGAIFLKPGVNLHLEKDAVLLGSPDITQYPARPTRIEGHTQVWHPALLNAQHCPGLRITGDGTIQGGGKPFWEEFLNRRHADKQTKNLDVGRPRNMFISDSDDVLVKGISLRDSGFWNLHLYRCRNVTVEGVDIETPIGAPSTDGIDVDCCRDVVIRNCRISVDDDDIAIKGGKGPHADRDPESPAVEHVLVTDCTFGLGHGVVTLGSEASTVRDVTVEHCKVSGSSGYNVLIRLKLRPDTPQHYGDIRFRDITFDSPGELVSIEPWTQYFDLRGEPAPGQTVENVTAERITGSTTRFGRIRGPGGSSLRNITFRDIMLTLKNPSVGFGIKETREGSLISGVSGLVLDKVLLNGSPLGEPPLYKAKR
jgi:alpha-L-rhamnosidase